MIDWSAYSTLDIRGWKYFYYWLIDWFINWLIDWSAYSTLDIWGWKYFYYWLIDWLECLFYPRYGRVRILLLLIDWLNNWLIDWLELLFYPRYTRVRILLLLIDWLNNWLIDWLDPTRMLVLLRILYSAVKSLVWFIRCLFDPSNVIKIFFVVMGSELQFG